MNAPAFRYVVVRGDMWGYGHRLDWVFDDPKSATEKASELQKLSDRELMDPTVAYWVAKEQS